MTKQKKGFLVFLCSLIPGAGELYMGFFQKGLSIMILFWSIFALCSATGMGWSLMFLPILWFYSFFDVHNLKSLQIKGAFLKSTVTRWPSFSLFSASACCGRVSPVFF